MKGSADYADYTEIKDKRTYRIIGCAMEEGSTDYADYAERINNYALYTGKKPALIRRNCVSIC